MSAYVAVRCLITAIILGFSILLSPVFADHKANHGGGGSPSTTTLSTLGCSTEGQVARVDELGQWTCEFVLDGVDGDQGPAGVDAQSTINYITTDEYIAPDLAFGVGGSISMTSPCDEKDDQITGGGCEFSGARDNTGWLLQRTVPGLNVPQPDLGGLERDEWQCTWTCNTPVSATAEVSSLCFASTFKITAICASQ